MGFGLLFFGYFSAFLMSLSNYGFLFSVIGCYVIFLALQKISDYKHSLLRAIYPLLGITLCSVLEAIQFFVGEFGIAGDILSLVMLCARVIFHCFLFISIISLGQDTDLPDVVALAKTNLIFILFSFAVEIVSMLLAILFGFSNHYLTLTVSMMRLLFPIFTLVLIFKCFHKICAPEDVDAPQKPSKFEFINEFRRRQEEREEERRKKHEAPPAPKAQAIPPLHKKRKKK